MDGRDVDRGKWQIRQLSFARFWAKVEARLRFAAYSSSHFLFRFFPPGYPVGDFRSQRASIVGSMAETLGKGTFLSHCGSRLGYIPPPRRPFLAQFAPFSISPLRTHSLPSPSKTDFFGMRLDVEAQTKRCLKSTLHSDPVKMGLSFVKAKNRWWMKELQPNMKEITSAGDLVNSLLSAGEKLVVVDFFSPGCGGCRALHPKICQIAEKNPDVLFLQVNYEEHRSMCYSLNVHVLPFFRFYRGAHGRLCSFSCTNATIKKFKDALGKHNTERCSLGPARGLEEAELLSLAANKDLCFAKETGEKALAAAAG